MELAELLAKPVFVAAWNNARLYKPSSYVAGLDTALGPQIALAKLSEMKGWEQFKVALIRQIEDPKLPRKPLKETFPDSGLPGIA